MKKLIFPLAFVALLLGSCYYDNYDELYPGASLFTPCDTSGTISYSQQIRNTLDNYCISCHSGSNPSGGVNLTDYATVNSY
ncbi:MAG TPA: hypothetical protein VFU15_04980, partial [Bacteroidia bacterium]|nr:hypothetical protein [Bacteroidia bacterium]